MANRKGGWGMPRRVRWAALLGTLIAAVAGACGGGGSSTSGGTDMGSSGGSGGGDSGGSGGSESGFDVSGTLASLSVSSDIGVGKAVTTSGTISHVVAVSPETGNIGCKTAKVDATGGFTLRLSAKKPWFLYFIDQQKQGRRMFLGRLLSGKLDTLTPASATGSLGLGQVTVDGSTGTASSAKSYGDIVSGLGLSASAAETIGKMDDVARRYGNPDVDGDGKVDCDDSGKRFLLDFHVRFNVLVGGRRVTVDDIMDTYWSDSATTDYTGTGVYVSYPKTFVSADTGTVTFVDAAVTTSEAGAVPANTPITAVTNNNYGDMNSFGPNTTGASGLPSGDILFSAGGKTLTFTDVKTPPLSEITAPTGRIFLFLKFNKTSPGCVANCTLSGVEYKWMKKTDGDWTAASQAELDVLVAGKGGFLSLRVEKDTDSSRTIGITLPKSSASGTIAWTAANATLSGLSGAAFTALVTTQLCHVGLSYDDELGMRYFEGIENASGTCR